MCGCWCGYPVTQNPKTDTEEIRGKLWQKSEVGALGAGGLADQRAACGEAGNAGNRDAALPEPESVR